MTRTKWILLVVTAILLLGPLLLPPYVHIKSIEEELDWGRVEHSATLIDYVPDANSGYLQSKTKLWLLSGGNENCTIKVLKYQVNPSTRTGAPSYFVSQYDESQIASKELASGILTEFFPIDDVIYLILSWRTENATFEPIEIRVDLQLGDKCNEPEKVISVTETLKPRMRRYTLWGIVKDGLMSV